MKLSVSNILFTLVSTLSFAIYPITVKATPEITPFIDVTNSSGIQHSVSGVDLDSFTGGGAAWIDFDNDGYDDLFVPNPISAQPSWLYHNNRDGTFTEMAAEAKVEDIGYLDANGTLVPVSSMGAVVGDIDNDGWDDLYVLHGANNVQAPLVGSQRNTLYRNNGDGTFTDVTVVAGLDGEYANSMAASYGDLNNDGYLDLYVGNYIVNGEMVDLKDVGCEGNHLYLNNSGTSGVIAFTEVAAALGVDNEGCTLGTVLSDYDADGLLDIYVTNDFTDLAAFATTPDVFYRNTSSGGQLSFDIFPGNGLTDTVNGMGIAVGDYDNDNDLDYYTTSFSSEPDEDTGELPPKRNVLNKNLLEDGLAGFTEATAEAGVADDPNIDPLVFSFGLGNLNIGWGTLFFDANHDGFVDLYRADGCIQTGCQRDDSPPDGTIGDALALIGAASFQWQPNNLFMNNKNGTFTELGDQAAVAGRISDPPAAAVVCPFLAAKGYPCFDQSRGVLSSDYDRDGDVDLFVLNVVGTSRLYQNQTADSAGGNSLELRLHSDSNHRGIGAKVRMLATIAGQSTPQLRELRAGSSHGSTNSFTLHFGLGDAAVADTVEIDWPSGCRQVIKNMPAGLHKVIENCDSFQFSGRVTFNGKGMAGVQVTDFFSVQNTFTDKDGFYTFTGYQPGDGAGVNLFFGRPGFSFPGNHIFEFQDSGSYGNDFSGQLIPSAVSGVIKTQGGIGLEGVTIIDAMTELMNGTGSGTAFSDENGFYVIPSTFSNTVMLSVNRKVNKNNGIFPLLPENGTEVFEKDPDVAAENHDFVMLRSSN